MAGKRLNDTDWGNLRRLYEADPSLTYAEIAENVGVTRQAVRQRATREGWQKRLDAGLLHEKAVAAADANFTEIAGDTDPQAGNVYSISESVAQRAEIDGRRAITVGIPEIAPGTPAGEVAQVAEDAAAQKRRKVLERQQKEWDYARSLVYDAIKGKDKKGAGDKARFSKTISEALKIIHEGERRTWGIGEEGGGGKPPAPPASIVVHMQQGVKIGG